MSEPTPLSVRARRALSAWAAATDAPLASWKVAAAWETVVQRVLELALGSGSP